MTKWLNRMFLVAAGLYLAYGCVQGGNAAVTPPGSTAPPPSILATSGDPAPPFTPDAALWRFVDYRINDDELPVLGNWFYEQAHITSTVEDLGASVSIGAFNEFGWDCDDPKNDTLAGEPAIIMACWKDGSLLLLGMTGFGEPRLTLILTAEV